MFKHILVATDGSEASEHAIRLAAGMARDNAARLACVYVIDPTPFMGLGDANAYGYGAYMQAAKQAGSQALAKASTLCQQATPAIEPSQHLVEHTPTATGIIDTAKELGADLIVLGSHGRSGLQRLMMGSVASKVVAHAPLPVLVTR